MESNALAGDRGLVEAPPSRDASRNPSAAEGELLHPNIAVRQFQRLATNLDLPVIRFHDLRYTAATLMLGDGVHPKIVQERLGHSDISMTLNRY
jgi:integrase